jgi:hypothetical protein
MRAEFFEESWCPQFESKINFAEGFDVEKPIVGLVRTDRGGNGQKVR